VDKAQELAALRDKLVAREGRTGLTDNVAAIKARIGELEKQA
jgi:hypothetical protein